MRLIAFYMLFFCKVIIAHSWYCYSVTL